jgi:hypothetical protein
MSPRRNLSKGKPTLVGSLLTPDTAEPPAPSRSLSATPEEVRIARQNLVPTKRGDVTASKHSPLVDDDRRNQIRERSRKLQAELNRPNTRKKYGLSRKDIAEYLKNPALAEGLKPHEVRWLRDAGYQNIKLVDLAAQLGVDPRGLDLILEPLEARVIGNARNRGIPIRHTPDELDADADFDKTLAADDAEVNSDFLDSVGIKADEPYPEY